MAIDEQILDFLSALASVDGYEAMSDAKLSSLEDNRCHLVITEDDTIRAVGSIATHEHGGSSHVAVETAVESSMRFPAFEKAVIEATTSLVPGGVNHSVWSQRLSMDRALEELGYEMTRTLAYMAVDLPLSDISPDGIPTPVLRSYTETDGPGVVAVNNAAFSNHREAGDVAQDAFRALTESTWFDPLGLIVASDASGVHGFCWTRVHPDGDGEIYRVAVDPTRQGQGLGRALVTAGFSYLSTQDNVARGTLWVDAENESAISLYRRIGMSVERTNREFEPIRQPKR